MRDTPSMWELAGTGMAVGGTGVWALAAAARVGVLRMLLDLFPRTTWDAVTWVLIPALLLAPIVVQGLAVAALAGRRARAWAGTTVAAVVGAGIAFAAIGAVLVLLVRPLPRGPQVWLERTAPGALIFGFTAAVIAGWLLVAGRLARMPRLRLAAVPVAAVVATLAWTGAHHLVIALSYVLDRPEANGFFAAVALGGGVGAAWAARRGEARVRPNDPSAGATNGA